MCTVFLCTAIHMIAVNVLTYNVNESNIKYNLNCCSCVTAIEYSFFPVNNFATTNILDTQHG